MITVANVLTYRGDMRRAAYVGRPTIYGNPFRLGRVVARDDVQDRQNAIVQFHEYWYAPAQTALRDRARRELVDIDVVLCWCFPLPCHAGVIAEFLNARPESTLPQA